MNESPSPPSWSADDRRVVSASFARLDRALESAEQLVRDGFGPDRISMFMTTRSRDLLIQSHGDDVAERGFVVDAVELEKSRKTVAGAGAGGAVGGALGAVGAALLAAGSSVVVPALGIVVAGPAAAALAGLGTGSAVGGLVGALVGSGMSEYRATRFASLVKEGRVVATVRVDTDPERTRATNVFEAHGGRVVRDD